MKKYFFSRNYPEMLVFRFTRGQHKNNFCEWDVHSEYCIMEVLDEMNNDEGVVVRWATREAVIKINIILNENVYYTEIRPQLSLLNRRDDWLKMYIIIDNRKLNVRLDRLKPRHIILKRAAHSSLMIHFLFVTSKINIE